MVTYGKTQTMLHFDGIITKRHVFADVPIAWTHVYIFEEKSSNVSRFIASIHYNTLYISKKQRVIFFLS